MQNVKTIEAVERERERERVTFSQIGFICGGKNNDAKEAIYTNEIEVKKEGKQLNRKIVKKRIGISLQNLLQKVSFVDKGLSFLCVSKKRKTKDKYT